jgi:DNA-binding response OmpR family regulator
MSKLVLICDDEPCILESVSHVAREEGYNVITADNGEDALNLAQTELPDLVLLDIMMPKKTGLEVCRELKASPDTRRIPIIFLTAMGQERDAQEGFECGAMEYITKPYSPRALRKRLHELLD